MHIKEILLKIFVIYWSKKIPIELCNLFWAAAFTSWIYCVDIHVFNYIISLVRRYHTCDRPSCKCLTPCEVRVNEFVVCSLWRTFCEQRPSILYGKPCVWSKRNENRKCFPSCKCVSFLCACNCKTAMLATRAGRRRREEPHYGSDGRAYILNEELRIVKNKKIIHCSDLVPMRSHASPNITLETTVVSLQTVELCKYCSAKLLSRCAHYSWLKLRAINS